LLVRSSESDNRSMKILRLSLLLPVLALFLACNSSAVNRGADGGDSGGPGQSADAGDTGGGACGTVSACGGDVVGTWKVTQSCVSATEDLSSACAGASASIDFVVAGTATFNADRTYTATSTGSGTTHYHYPSACLNGSTCVQFGEVLMAVGMYSSSACATDGTGACNCDAVTSSTASTQIGTYSISGGTLTTVSDGMAVNVPYCVTGNVMQQLPASSDGGAPRTTGSVVFTRQ
jgi:hypothetical protein